jgi:hypothetical protein
MKFWIETREGDFEILERADSSQLPEATIRFGRANRFCSGCGRAGIYSPDVVCTSRNLGQTLWEHTGHVLCDRCSNTGIITGLPDY